MYPLSVRVRDLLAALLLRERSTIAAFILLVIGVIDAATGSPGRACAVILIAAYLFYEPSYP